MHCASSGRRRRATLAHMTSSTKPEVYMTYSTPSQDDRATAIGSVHKKLVKIGHAVPKIRSRTDRQTRSSQYSAIPHRRRSSYLYLFVAVDLASSGGVACRIQCELERKYSLESTDPRESEIRAPPQPLPYLMPIPPTRFLITKNLLQPFRR